MLLYARWAANLMKQDASLYDIYAAEELTSLNPGKICWQVHQLKEVWQNQRPKLKRLSCDSFVLRSRNSSFLGWGLKFDVSIFKFQIPEASGLRLHNCFLEHKWLKKVITEVNQSIELRGANQRKSQEVILKTFVNDILWSGVFLDKAAVRANHILVVLHVLSHS